MDHNISLLPRTTAPSLFVAALVVVSAFGAVANAMAQNVMRPATPAKITPPAGAIAFLVGHAHGTQGYVCLPASTGGASWTILNARPEATLFTRIFGQEFQIITHFLSLDSTSDKIARSTWQSSFDTSKVWAQEANFITAGTDASCPKTGSIDCLLLQATGTQEGPTGGKFLTKTTFIQRLNTVGGSAPVDNTGCSADTVGHQLLVPYSADYYFFRGGE